MCEQKEEECPACGSDLHPTDHPRYCPFCGCGADAERERIKGKLADLPNPWYGVPPMDAGFDAIRRALLAAIEETK